MIEVKNLTFSYSEDIHVLNDLSFEAKDGEVTVLLGANGAGKSTLMKIMAGIYESENNIFIDGVATDSVDRIDLYDKLAYMSQEEGADASITVLDTVLLGMLKSLHIKMKDEEVEAAMKMLENLGISDLALRPYYALSGGQKKLVDAAQTLIKNPTALLMDEATAGLDLKHEMQMLDLIRYYTHKKKSATILSLHDLNMSARYADKIMLLRNGSIYKEGSVEEILTEENIAEIYGVKSKVYNKDGRTIVETLEPLEKQEWSF